MSDDAKKIESILRKDYTGVFGAKVFWLAILTLLPVLVGMKVSSLKINLSISTIIYIIYHGLGLLVWARTRRVLDFSVFEGEERTQELSSILKIHKFVKPLSWLVVILISLTLIAKAVLIFGGKEYRLPLPGFVYDILGVPDVYEDKSEPDNTECVTINNKYKNMLTRIKTVSSSCAGLSDARLTYVSSADECSRRRAEGKVCIVDAGNEENWAKDIFMLQNEMWDVYVAKNNRLMGLFRQSAEALVQKSSQSVVAMVQAPAGTGKSWLLRGTFHELKDRKIKNSQGETQTRFLSYDSSGEILLRLDNLASWYQGSSEATLKIGGKDFDKLKGSATTAEARDRSSAIIRSLLEEYRNQWENTILVLDSIDEVHPAVREIIYKELDLFVSGAIRDESSVNVYLFGRPEAMLEKVDIGDVKANRVYIDVPDYGDIENLSKRWNNWVLYRKSVHGIPAGKNTPIDDIIVLAHRSPTICTSLPHLTSSAWIIDQGKEWISRDETVIAEEKIQAALLDRLLQRNSDTHGRPSISESLYLELFGEFVAKHLSYVDDEGAYFRVHFDMRIGEGSDAPHARELLEHSGLIDIDPIDSRKYRFFPDWVPLTFMRSHAKRIGCRLPTISTNGDGVMSVD